jgi:hypothetical protein
MYTDKNLRSISDFDYEPGKYLFIIGCILFYTSSIAQDSLEVEEEYEEDNSAW